MKKTPKITKKPDTKDKPREKQKVERSSADVSQAAIGNKIIRSVVNSRKICHFLGRCTQYFFCLVLGIDREMCHKIL